MYVNLRHCSRGICGLETGIGIMLTVYNWNFVIYCFQAAILQHTAEFIQNLKREKDRLESENSQLQRMLEVYNDSPPRKRWKREAGIMSGGLFIFLKFRNKELVQFTKYTSLMVQVALGRYKGIVCSWLFCNTQICWFSIHSHKWREI